MDLPSRTGMKQDPLFVPQAPLPSPCAQHAICKHIKKRQLNLFLLPGLSPQTTAALFLSLLARKLKKTKWQHQGLQSFLSACFFCLVVLGVVVFVSIGRTAFEFWNSC